nr:IPT/TIG domain-containing protein [Deltaproteobacteria bacterium]
MTLPPERLDAGADARVDAGPDARPMPAPTLVGVQPGHGSFLGGTEVTLRGSNFTEEAVVRFGGNLVQPRYTTFVDRNRITVRTPAGALARSTSRSRSRAARARFPGATAMTASTSTRRSAPRRAERG